MYCNFAVSTCVLLWFIRAIEALHQYSKTIKKGVVKTREESYFQTRSSNVIVFVYHLQTETVEKEDEVSPEDNGLLKEAEPRDRANSGIVNPGMEARKQK